MIQGIKNTSSETFQRLMGNGFSYSVPKYQRDYSWGQEQWNDLWYDIQQMIAENDSHYMGYLVLQTNDDRNFQIIDGQQRLTTLSVLILAVIKCLKDLPGTEGEKKANELRASDIRSSYIGNLDRFALVSVNKLVLNRNNDRFYKSHLSTLQIPLRVLNSSNKLMLNAFESFLEYLKATYTTANDFLEFMDAIANNLFFTVITVSDELNAFKVFETLNARGVQLSSSDLLKNYIFSVANQNGLHELELDEIENKWADIADVLQDNNISDFLWVYWNSNHKAIRKNQLYKTIREEVKTPDQAIALLQDLRTKADIYMALQNSADELWAGKAEIQKALELLHLFALSQPVPLLITACSNLQEKDFVKLLQAIVVVSFRYNIICGKNPVVQEAAYNRIALSIIANKAFSVDELKTSIYVADEEFEQTFAYKEFVYNSRNNKIAKYILVRLENFENGSAIDEDSITLEHILPDNPDDSWGWDDMMIQQYHYRLGNMILLEYVKNKNLGNVPFLEKKAVYAQSTVKTTQSLGNSDVDEWTEDEINKRQKRFAKLAKGIWRL